MEHSSIQESRSREREASSASLANLRGNSALKDLETKSLCADNGRLAPQRFAALAIPPLALPIRHSLPVLMRSPASSLTVNQPGDPFEQEADRVADHVMRMASPVTVQRKCSSCAQEEQIQRTCADCEKEENKKLQRKCDKCDEEDKDKLQRRDTSGGPRVAPPIVREVLSSPGHPLDAATRAFMEPRFGHDFSNVRVHADERAAQSATAVNALVYTVGEKIVFGAGRYLPEVDSGQRLIAHELTHVVQQAGQSPYRQAQGVDARTDSYGQEAEPVATSKMGGKPFGPIARTHGVIQRQDGGRPAPEAVAAPSAPAPLGDAGAGPAPASEPAPAAPGPAATRKCGPDITTALSGVLSSVGPYFRGLTSWQKRRSCMALDIDAPLALVNPGMAWDTRELFLPETYWLDGYYRRSGCGSPRDPGCETDDTRNLCETPGTCGNSVVVDGKCMLAGTANYALYGTMFKLCNTEFSPDYPRWDMRAMIWLWKVIPDDPGPPLAMATAAFDGTIPPAPAGAENRGSCTDRCGATHAGAFDFIWEPYRSR